MRLCAFSGVFRMPSGRPPLSGGRFSPPSRLRGPLSALPVALVCLLLCGCPATIITSGPAQQDRTGQTGAPAASPGAQARDMSLAGQARQAWDGGNMQEAERLYGIIARSAQSGQADQLPAWERVALSAVRNKHPRSALDALEQWRLLAPDADSRPAWQDTWGQALMHVGDGEALRAAEAMWDDTARPAPLRGMAAGISMVLRPDAAEEQAGRLTDLYESADAATRAGLEQRLLTLLGEAADVEVLRLSGLAGPGRDHVYPWTVVLLEDLSRETSRNGPRAAELAGRIDAPGVFADAALLKKALSGNAQPSYLPVPGSAVPFNSGCVALALPMSGPYAPIGQKVAAGATAAGKALAGSGHTMSVVIVDTESADWLDRLNALPPQCVAVGGPLRADAYTAAKARGLTGSKAIFAFLPGLEGNDEGAIAWRFFASPEDQIAAVLRFTGQLGITSYGVLMPDDSYGRRMSNLFVQTAESGGSQVKLTSYTPGSTTNWSSLMSGFVGSYMAGKVPMSSATFQAVFLPDSWQNIEKMVPYLFYQGEDRLVLMGTTLWEPTLSSKSRVNVENMDLAIFPGAWNSLAVNPAASALISGLAGEAGQEKPDAWNAMGFDFVRFASALNLDASGWTPQTVNERIATAQAMDWSMAPIHWNQGRAAQQLFIFHPTSTGFEPVDNQAFRQRLDEIRARYARRRK